MAHQKRDHELLNGLLLESAPLKTADGAVIQGNILDVTNQYQGTDWRINELESNDVRCFNNRDSAGNLIRSYNRDTSRHEDSLEDGIQSALLAAI